MFRLPGRMSSEFRHATILLDKRKQSFVRYGALQVDVQLYLGNCFVPVTASETRLEGPLLASHFQHSRVELNKRPFDCGVLGMALHAWSERITGQRLRNVE